MGNTSLDRRKNSMPSSSFLGVSLFDAASCASDTSLIFFRATVRLNGSAFFFFGAMAGSGSTDAIMRRENRCERLW